MVVWAVGALTAGLGIRAVARVCEVDPNTVRQWLVAAADHLNAFSPDFLHDVRVTQGQLDALCALLSAGKAGKGSAAEAIERLARAPPGIWVALDPVTTLRLALDVGAICGPSGRPDRGARRHAAVPHRWRQGVDHGAADPLRPVGPAPTPPGQRPHAEAPVATAAAAALCARGEDRAAAPAGAGESARGLWPPRGRQAGRSGLRLAEPDSLSRAGPPGNASAGGRRGAACRHVMQGRGRVASAARPVPRLRQLLLAACQLTSAPAPVPAHQRHGLREAMAALDARDGGGADGSGVDPTGGVALARAAVAAASRGVSQQGGGKRHGKVA